MLSANTTVTQVAATQTVATLLLQANTRRVTLRILSVDDPVDWLPVVGVTFGTGMVIEAGDSPVSFDVREPLQPGGTPLTLSFICNTALTATVYVMEE